MTSKTTEPKELPEAGGVAWTDIYRPDGGKVGLTARAHNPSDALADLDNAMTYATEVLGWFLSPVRANQNGNGEVSAEFQAVHDEHAGKQNGTVPAGDEWFQITHVTPELTKTGKVMLKAYGGRWTKFGVTLWPEVAATMIKDPEQREPGVQINTPGLTGRVEFNDKGNPSKVVELAKA